MITQSTSSFAQSPIERTLLLPFSEFIVRLRIAKEHGGSVYIDESHRERTVFTLSLTKNRSLPFRET